jgi:hypothetical protein
MKIKLNQTTRASAADIGKLEAFLGEPLDSSFRKFVLDHDGAEPEDNTFRLDPTGSRRSEIRRFVPVKDIPSLAGDLELPTKCFPVSYDSTGNHVIIDQTKGGAVFFLDHEIDTPPAFLAGDFDSFLDLLEPFTGGPSLQPGQARTVWKHPDFETKFAKFLKPKADPQQ